MASAGFWSDFKAKITGELTSQPVDLNITVTSGTAPTIPFVRNDTMTDVSGGPTEGPVKTDVFINFTAYDADGFGNLNHSSAWINFSRAGQTTRENASCALVTSYAVNYANYTCDVSMWWWDGTGIWNITAYIADLSANTVTNTSRSFSLGTTTGVTSSPSALTFPSVAPGATNKLSTNDPMLFNNTVNMPPYLEVHSTELVGESDYGYSLYASTFTVNTADACAGTTMVVQTYVNISGNSFPTGHYTLSAGTAQEELYFSLEQAGSELKAQTHYTSVQRSWRGYVSDL